MVFISLFHNFHIVSKIATSAEDKSVSEGRL